MQEKTGSRAWPVIMQRHPAVKIKTLKEAYESSRLRSLAHRIHRIDTSSLDIDLKRPWKPLGKRERFVLSVCLSHLTAYQLAMNEFSGDTRGYIMVMEDDVKLRGRRFVERMEDIVRRAPSDWKVIRLGTWGTSRDHDLEYSSGNNLHFYRAVPPFYNPHDQEFFYGGAHAILLRIRALPQILNQLFAQDLTDIDAMLTNYPHLMSYTVPYPDTYKILKIVKTSEQSHPAEFTLENDSLAERNKDAGTVYETNWWLARLKVMGDMMDDYDSQDEEDNPTNAPQGVVKDPLS